MRILYLTYDGLTDPLGSSQVLPYIRGLAGRGVEFTLISFEKPGWKEKAKEIQQNLKKEGIRWIPLSYHKYPPVFSTLYDLRSLRKAVDKELSSQSYDVIHCRSYITAMVGLENKRKGKSKFLFDMRGYWADERVEGDIWDMRNPVFKSIYKYFKKKEREFLQEADYVITLTENSGNYLSKHFSIKNMEVIPCCTDTRLFTPTPEDPGPNKYLGYLGSLGTWYMVKEMIEFFSVFRQHAPEYKLMIITQDNTDQLAGLLSTFQLDKDQVEMYRAEREQVPSLMAGWKAMISFIKPVFSKTASSPTKIGEALSMNLPVIVNSGIGDLDAQVEPEGLGVVVRKFDREEYRVKAAEVLQIIQKGNFDGRNWVRDHLSLEMGVEEYYKVYENLVNAS